MLLAPPAYLLLKRVNAGSIIGVFVMLQFTHLNDEAVQHEDSGHEEGNAERAEQPAADAQLCRSEATGDRAKRRHMLFGHRFRERQDV
jgi:hypothetical protein